MKRLVKFIICISVLTSLLLVGCSTKVEADISSYENEKILVTGLLENDFYITPSELAELKCVKESQTGRTAKAGTVNAVGPTMDTFLEKYDKKQTDFSKIKFYAKDKYYTYLWNEELQEKTIILSVANGKEALSDNQKPLRVLIPGVESSRWIRMVNKIEFTE